MSVLMGYQWLAVSGYGQRRGLRPISRLSHDKAWGPLVWAAFLGLLVHFFLEMRAAHAAEARESGSRS